MPVRSCRSFGPYWLPASFPRVSASTQLDHPFRPALPVPIYTALPPRSVLVTCPASGKPQVRILNWQLGRSLGTFTSPSGRPTTLDPQQLAEDSRWFTSRRRPLPNPRGRGETMDVFSAPSPTTSSLERRPPTVSRNATRLSVVAKVSCSPAFWMASRRTLKS